ARRGWPPRRAAIRSAQRAASLGDARRAVAGLLDDLERPAPLSPAGGEPGQPPNTPAEDSGESDQRRQVSRPIEPPVLGLELDVLQPLPHDVFVHVRVHLDLLTSKLITVVSITCVVAFSVC